MDMLVDFAQKRGLKLVVLNVISSYKQLNIDIEQKYRANANVLFLSNLSLEETGSLLVGARFFIGSSLHCAITTLAACKPAAVIHQTQLTKLQDLFGHMMRTDLLSNDWDALPNMLNKLYGFDRNSQRVLKKYVSFMQQRFDAAMDDLVKRMLYKCNV